MCLNVMTTITIRKQNGSYREILCMGHAEYAKQGEPDILCAAVSVLVIGTMNGLEALAGERFEAAANEETGFMRYVFDEKHPLQEKSVFSLDSMVYNLEDLSRQYGTQYLQINIEEV